VRSGSNEVIGVKSGERWMVEWEEGRGETEEWVGKGGEIGERRRGKGEADDS